MVAEQNAYTIYFNKIKEIEKASTLETTQEIMHFIETCIVDPDIIRPFQIMQNNPSRDTGLHPDLKNKGFIFPKITFASVFSLKEVQEILNKKGFEEFIFTHCKFLESPIFNTTEKHPIFKDCDFKCDVFYFETFTFPCSNLQPSTAFYNDNKNKKVIFQNITVQKDPSDKKSTNYNPDLRYTSSFDGNGPISNYVREIEIIDCKINTPIRIMEYKDVTIKNCTFDKEKVVFENNENVSIIQGTYSTIRFTNAPKKATAPKFLIDNISVDNIYICDAALNQLLMTKTKIKNLEIKASEITEFLNIKDCKISEDINVLSLEKFPANFSFEGTEFQNTKNKDSEILYRELRIKCKERGSENYAQLFAALELESRYNTFLKKNWRFLNPEYSVEVLSSIFLKDFYQYGRNLSRGIIIFSMIILVFSLLYANNISCDITKTPKDSTWVNSVCSNSFNMQLYYSVRNSFGPLGAIIGNDIFYPQNMWVKGVEIFQILFSTLLWFLLINALRKRFKL